MGWAHDIVLLRPALISSIRSLVRAVRTLVRGRLLLAGYQPQHGAPSREFTRAVLLKHSQIRVIRQRAPSIRHPCADRRKRRAVQAAIHSLYCSRTRPSEGLFSTTSRGLALRFSPGNDREVHHEAPPQSCGRGVQSSIKAASM